MQVEHPTVLIISDEVANAQLVRQRWPRASILRRDENWLDALVLAASEAVHRAQAETRARTAEQSCAELERQAMLGRFMLDMRHNVNNALTTVLGNSDLLLLEPGSLSAPARAQIDTIRNMALRIHEVLQRFSSLEKEMHMVALQAERDSGKSRVAMAGR